MKLKDILTKRFTSKWWLDKPIESEKIRYILDCLYECPSKQSKYNYNIHVLYDSEQSIKIKQWMYWKDTVCVRGHRGDTLDVNPTLNRFNGQVLAPIVMIWVAKKRTESSVNDCMVSSTIAMLAAEECGLNTGFNGCMSRRKTADILGYGKEAYAIISMGFGYGVQAIKNNITKAKIYKEGVHVGWDHMNVDPSITTTWNRIQKPKKDSFIITM